MAASRSRGSEALKFSSRFPTNYYGLFKMRELDMDDTFIKEKKMKEKALRRKMYLSAKERLKNDPVHQTRLLEQKNRMKAYRSEQAQKSKAKKRGIVGEVSDVGFEGLEKQALNSSSKSPLDLLIQTASDSTLRPLGEIISVDFRSKKRQEVQE